MEWKTGTTTNGELVYLVPFLRGFQSVGSRRSERAAHFGSRGGPFLPAQQRRAEGSSSPGPPRWVLILFLLKQQLPSRSIHWTHDAPQLAIRPARCRRVPTPDLMTRKKAITLCNGRLDYQSGRVIQRSTWRRRAVPPHFLAGTNNSTQAACLRLPSWLAAPCRACPSSPHSLVAEQRINLDYRASRSIDRSTIARTRKSSIPRHAQFET